MYAAGSSYSRIAKTLNAEGVLSPQRPRTGTVRGWCPSAIREMLLNEKYRGWVVWNRTKNVRNRETERIAQRPRPESEWVRVEIRELRIVSDQLWKEVREQNSRVREKHGPKRLGGMNRTEASRRYLFSGLMQCGLCGKNITIVSGQVPYSRYGCPNHRFRGVCKNNVTISQRKLEKQLIAAFSANLLGEYQQEQLAHSFSERIRAAKENEAKLARQAVAHQPELKEERSLLTNQVANLVRAIADYGMSPNLKAQLATTEARLAEVGRMLSAKRRPETPTVSDEEIHEFLTRKSREIADVLAGDPEFAKQELQKRITKLVLTPKETPAGPVLEVSGDILLFTAADVMHTNSLHGIAQHYILNLTLNGLILTPGLRLGSRAAAPGPIQAGHGSRRNRIWAQGKNESSNPSGSLPLEGHQPATTGSERRETGFRKLLRELLETPMGIKELYPMVLQRQPEDCPPIPCTHRKGAKSKSMEWQHEIRRELQTMAFNRNGVWHLAQ
jgi:site-specific DNA recombinase